MKRSKNSTTLLLMASSILLLLVLQFFWLRSAYRDAAEDFQKETNLLFRNTIFAMQDSLILRGIEPVSGNDTTFIHNPLKKDDHVSKRFLLFHDSVSVAGFVRGRDPNRDMLEKGVRIEIFNSSGLRDSIGRLLRPIIAKYQHHKESRSFIYRMGIDSLPADSIQDHYKAVLHEAGIPADFKVLSFDGRRPGTGPVRPPLERFTTEIIPMNPIHHYAVAFSGIENILLKEITPQIVFSIFLTLLTIGSFHMMYKNLRSQQRLNLIINDFINNVTHELKTPVATVSVAIEALKNFHALDSPERTDEYLTIAQRELSRLTLMTDKILKTAVYEDRGIEVEFAPLDMDRLIQEVLSSLKLVFEKRKTVWQYQKKGNDFTLEGSQAHLMNVLYNLLDNGLKYSPGEGVLDITLERSPNQIMLSVKDNGIGIAPEYQKRIFEKFFRVPSGDVHNTKGYGLGLSYVASVIKSHGGKIVLESDIGKGSCFVVTLPVRSNS